MDMRSAEDSDPLAALLRSLPGRRQEIGDARRLPRDVVEGLREAGIYRALVAKRFGGCEVSPATFLEMIERISQVDASTGWVASFGFSAIYLSALPLRTLEHMYAAGPDVIFAGGIFPPQPAIPVDGGLQVKGRWPWGSGSTGADLIGVGIKVDGGDTPNGLPLIAVMPAEKVSIAENWNVTGLKGTGSHDMVVDDVVVPYEWTFVRGGASSLDGALYRYPTMALAAQVLAVVALGAARGALADLGEIAGGRTSITGAPVLANRAHVQIGYAKSAAALESARAYFYDTTRSAYAKLEAGDELGREDIVPLRLAATHAARIGADVCQDVFRLTGTTGVFADNIIGQRMQDALIVPQHAFLAEGTYEAAGRCLLGLDGPPGYP